jgi:hypothetical protein
MIRASSKGSVLKNQTGVVSVESIRSELGSAVRISHPISLAVCKGLVGPCARRRGASENRMKSVWLSRTTRHCAPHSYGGERLLPPSAAPVIAATPAEQEHQHDDQDDEIHEFSFV